MVRVAKPEKGKGGIKKLWVKIPIFFLLLLYKIQPRKVPEFQIIPLIHIGNQIFHVDLESRSTLFTFAFDKKKTMEDQIGQKNLFFSDENFNVLLS